MGQVSLKAIHKQYGDQQVIKGVTLEVIDGEFLALCDLQWVNLVSYGHDEQRNTL